MFVSAVILAAVAHFSAFFGEISMYGGLMQLPWWGYVLVTLCLTHITIASVTIYLHRSQAHHAVKLSAIPSHFFRFWLWLTTGMNTEEWVSVHRKHHAKCETKDDPHSPVVYGLWRVLFAGVLLYVKESLNPETIERYGAGTPDDAMERHLYVPFKWYGIVFMFGVDLLLFGFIAGPIIWLVQMLWIPFWAAGVINGAGHAVGYRNTDTKDRSTNIVPWGIVIGGEELHNNHHAHPTWAKLSLKWFEFDIGWLYIRILEIIGWAEVRRMT